jgi:hypothetical protein
MRAAAEYANHNPYCRMTGPFGSFDQFEGCIIAPHNTFSIPVFINGTDFYNAE